MNARKPVYLDHAATSPMRPEVWEAMSSVIGEADFNPASTHAFGRKAQSKLEEARGVLADALGGDRGCMVFTGGGTLSDNLAVLGFARSCPEPPRLIVSSMEHKAVLESARHCEANGSEVHYLPVDSCGVVNLDALESLLEKPSDRKTLVSVMWANNEVGAVQPLAQICEMAHEHGALCHTDAVQAFGKIPVSVQDVPVDMLTITAHKLGGPVGIGLLYVADGVDLEPLAYGGSQERSLWPGTQNPTAATGFAVAARMAVEEMPSNAARWTQQRDRLGERILSGIPEAEIHCAGTAHRLPHLLSMGIPGCDQAIVLTSLDMLGLAVSGGSACSSGASRTSHVLKAMGLSEDGDYTVLRFSQGHDTSAEDIDLAADLVLKVVGRRCEELLAG
ncbi:MAG: cysteine desulfurase family protein [Gemmatimonadota bacterium]